MSAKTTTFDDDVIIRGNLTVQGELNVAGEISCSRLRTRDGLVRFGYDDGSDSQDVELWLQHGCGSYNLQSALCLKPVNPVGGALLLLIPGDDIKPGTIDAQVMLYGPLHPGNLRRQRVSLTVFRQSDGHPFATLDTTMSGQGDPQGIREIPVLFNVAATTTARMDGGGFKITPKEGGR